MKRLFYADVGRVLNRLITIIFTMSETFNQSSPWMISIFSLTDAEKFEWNYNIERKLIFDLSPTATT